MNTLPLFSIKLRWWTGWIPIFIADVIPPFYCNNLQLEYTSSKYHSGI